MLSLSLSVKPATRFPIRLAALHHNMDARTARCCHSTVHAVNDGHAYCGVTPDAVSGVASTSISIRTFLPTRNPPVSRGHINVGEARLS